MAHPPSDEPLHGTRVDGLLAEEIVRGALLDGPDVRGEVLQHAGDRENEEQVDEHDCSKGGGGHASDNLFGLKLKCATHSS